MNIFRDENEVHSHWREGRNEIRGQNTQVQELLMTSIKTWLILISQSFGFPCQLSEISDSTCPGFNLPGFDRWWIDCDHVGE